MAAKQEKKEVRDFIKEYLDLAYEKCMKSKHHAQVHLDHYQNITLVTVTIYDRKQTVWFVDGLPNFAYWLTQEQRIPFVAKMWKEGITGTTIAKMLGFSPSTIYKDLKYLREVSPFQIEGRFTKELIKPSKTILPEGEMRMIALNAMSQRQQLDSAFKSVRNMTMQ